MKTVIVTRDGHAFHEIADYQHRGYLRVKKSSDIASVPAGCRVLCIPPYPAGMNVIVDMLKDKGCVISKVHR